MYNVQIRELDFKENLTTQFKKCGSSLIYHNHNSGSYEHIKHFSGLYYPYKSKIPYLSRKNYKLIIILQDIQHFKHINFYERNIHGKNKNLLQLSKNINNIFLVTVYEIYKILVKHYKMDKTQTFINYFVILTENYNLFIRFCHYSKITSENHNIVKFIYSLLHYPLLCKIIALFTAISLKTLEILFKPVNFENNISRVNQLINLTITFYKSAEFYHTYHKINLRHSMVLQFKYRENMIEIKKRLNSGYFKIITCIGRQKNTILSHLNIFLEKNAFINFYSYSETHEYFSRYNNYYLRLLALHKDLVSKIRTYDNNILS